MKGAFKILLIIPLVGSAAVPAAVECVPSDFTVRKFTSSSDRVLQGGTVYCVTENLELTGTNAVAAGGTGGNALSVAPGATVYLHIGENVTLTCAGGRGAGGTAGGTNASPAFTTGTYTPETESSISVTSFDFGIPPGGAGGRGGGGGGAGILVPANSTLVVFGRGKLVASGGKGGDAGAAGEANARGKYAMTAWCTASQSLFEYFMGPSNYISNTGIEQRWIVTGLPTYANNFNSITGQPSSGAGGGGGGGGGGAAIGQPGQSGSDGTDGAASAMKWIHSTNLQPGETTNRLESAHAAAATAPADGQAAGTIRFGGDLTVRLEAGGGGRGVVSGSEVPSVTIASPFYWHPLADDPAAHEELFTVVLTQRLYFAEGQCGGAGGGGGAGARIGRGGGGGTGGSGGDSGSLVCARKPDGFAYEEGFADGPLQPLSAPGANGSTGVPATDDTCQTNAVSIFQVTDSNAHAAAIGINPFGSFYEACLGDGTVGEKNAKLTEQGVNTLLLWQNYLLGLWQNTAQPFWADVPQGNDAKSATVFAKVGAQRPDPAETGIGVAFRIDAKLRGATAETPGEPCAEPVMPLALGAADPTGMYRVKAVFTNSAGFVSIAPATNQIGVLRKPAQQGGRRRDCMSVPWTELSSDNTKHGVAVSNVVRTAQLDPGDMLYRYDAYNGCYNVWKLDANHCWQQLTTIVAADETSGTSPSGPASTTRIQRGAAFWLERDVSRPLDFIGGNEKRVPWVPVTAGTPEQPKWNLVSAAGYDAFDINVINEKVDPKDRIILPTGGEPLVFTFADEKWCHSEYVVDDQGFVTVVRKDDKTDIPAGSGFWYVSEGGNPMIKFPEVKLK